MCALHPTGKAPGPANTRPQRSHAATHMARVRLGAQATPGTTALESAAATNAATIAAIFEAQTAVSAARSVRQEGMDAGVAHVRHRLGPAAHLLYMSDTMSPASYLTPPPMYTPMLTPKQTSMLTPANATPGKGGEQVGSAEWSGGTEGAEGARGGEISGRGRGLLPHHSAAVRRAPFVYVKSEGVKRGYDVDVPAGSADGGADAGEHRGDASAEDEADGVWKVVGGWGPRQELALLEEGVAWVDEAAAAEQEEEKGKKMSRTTFFCDGAVLKGKGGTWSLSSLAENEVISNNRRSGAARQASFRVIHGQEEGAVCLLHTTLTHTHTRALSLSLSLSLSH